ncbi:lithostathine-2 isoform X2 [Calliopsis andreniformis]|uniref:lithostathine-2 isoform X2 n=1 Tax=Calliopsis andreniformis TaxID=337506 RepID=UPI003FCE088C
MRLPCLILILCATGTLALVVLPYNNSINQVPVNQPGIGRHNEPIRRFACPIGFFRLKGYCYYLSAGMATWRDAHFLCKDRNATLAILDRNGKDKMLRKYLENDQFMKLERWIGGIFNWQKMAWEWGVTGEEMVFQNFGKPQTGQPKQQYAWHCVTIDPTLNYKWSPRSCVERKYYVCQVRPGRIPRRRKKTIDPYAPQNQRLKPRKKGKKYSKEPQKPNKPKKPRPMWRNWAEQNADNYWVHGVNAGSRPPSKNRMRHHANRTPLNRTAPRVAQVLPQGSEYGAFLGDGPIYGSRSLTDISKGLSQIPGKINDLASEEVILKP